MQGNKRKDTKPELLVRKALREAGYTGYRLPWKKAPGRPDIAFPGRKVAIFIDGCFWHHHEGCKYATTPATNTEFWEDKFARNKARDERDRKLLAEDGWTVISIWECELKKDMLSETINYVVMTLDEIDSSSSQARRGRASAARASKRNTGKKE